MLVLKPKSLPFTLIEMIESIESESDGTASSNGSVPNCRLPLNRDAVAGKTDVGGSVGAVTNTVEVENPVSASNRGYNIF